jgi:hypothetical protein
MKISLEKLYDAAPFSVQQDSGGTIIRAYCGSLIGAASSPGRVLPSSLAGRKLRAAAVRSLRDSMDAALGGIADVLEPGEPLTKDERAELELLRLTAAYSCCCIDGSGCDCFTKRDPDWRAIPGNYPCPKCCNENCKGGSDPCSAECFCDDEDCAAHQAEESEGKR